MNLIWIEIGVFKNNFFSRNELARLVMGIVFLEYNIRRKKKKVERKFELLPERLVYVCLLTYSRECEETLGGGGKFANCTLIIVSLWGHTTSFLLKLPGCKTWLVDQ